MQELVVDGLAPGAHFGAAVAVSENAIVAGAPGSGSGTMLSSAAFVFEAMSGMWTLNTVLDVNGPSVDDRVGASVAIDGPVIVIGAPGSFGGQGLVYVLERINGLWTETASLSPSATAQQAFGTAVAVSGDVIVVASAGNDPVSVFRRQGDAWPLVTELHPGGAVNQDSIAAIAIDGTTIAATGTVQSGTAVFGYESQDGGASWQEVGPFGAGGTGDAFGAALALGTNTLLIGAPTAGTPDTGTVYLYSQASGPNLVEFAAENGQSGFGSALAFAGELAVIGAPLSRVGQNAEQGTAIVRSQNANGPNGWGVVATLVAPDGAGGDHFGAAVGAGELNVVVGAPLKSGETGAAYVFPVNPAGPEPEPTVVATATPRPVFDDDGCAVTPPAGSSRVGFILLLLPLVVALLRR